MKKILLLFALTIVATSAMGRDNLLSRLLKNSTANQASASQTTAVKVNKHKADSIYTSISQLYTQGKIPADSVISLAVYHKVWSPELAERCLQLVTRNATPRSMMELGAIYAFSPEFGRRANEGVKLLQAAAKGGCKEANEYLGLYYFNKNDFAKAKTYLNADIPMTYGFGYAALGNMYFNGKAVNQNREKAREFYHNSALKGYPRGMSMYGYNLHTGEGGETDLPEAFFWLYMAGDLGEDAARTTLFLPRRSQEFGDSETGRTTTAVLNVVEALHNKQNIKDEPIYKEGFLAGLKDREKAAEQGDDWSRFYLGSLNYNGEFLNQNYAQALRYYEPIAKNGKLPRAVLAVVNERLAKMYSEGNGTKANPAKAAQYAQKAAKYGSLAGYKATEKM